MGPVTESKFFQHLYLCAISLFLILLPGSLLADKDNFISWLLRTWSYDTPAGVYYNNPPTVFIYVEHDEWIKGESAWQNDAGRSIACAIPETFPEWKIRPPFRYELLIHPLPPGGAVTFFQEGIITEKSCSREEKMPFFFVGKLLRKKFLDI